MAEMAGSMASSVARESDTELPFSFSSCWSLGVEGEGAMWKGENRHGL